MTTALGTAPIAANEGDRVDLAGLGIVWKIEGAESDGRFSVVHHPLAPRALAAPLQRHTREDEYSYVLEGTLGALLGDEVVTATPGTWVFKPRNQWHTDLCARYGLEMDPTSVPGLVERFGLRFPGEPL